MTDARPSRGPLARLAVRIAAQIAAGALSLALGACATGLTTSPPTDLDNLRQPPETLPLPREGAADALLGGSSTSTSDPSGDWGDGVLRANGGEALRGLKLPLFDAPRSGHWGWITQGQVYDLNAERTLPDRRDVMVPAAGVRGWLVLDRAEGGWLQIRYGQRDDRGGGLAWTNLQLSDGARAAYVSWPQLLADARGVVFRTAGAHNLRAEPSTSAAIVEELSGDNFDMRVLDIQGDWMRVEVSTPPACTGSVARDQLLGGSSTQLRRGWVAWRSSERGPWVEAAAGARCAPGA